MVSATSPSECVVRNGYEWSLDASIRLESLERILEAFPHLERLEGVKVLKSNHFRTVFHVPPHLISLKGGQEESSVLQDGLIAKAYRYTSPWDRFRYLWMRHRAEQERFALERFSKLGLPAPRWIAVAQMRRFGVIESAGLLLSFLPGAAPVLGALGPAELRGTDAESGAASRPLDRVELLQRVGKLVRLLHDRGVWHRDLHAANVLFSPKEDALYFIDLHSSIFFKRTARWQRWGGLVKLLHSLRGVVPPPDLYKLVEAYGAEALVPGQDMRGVERRLAERIEKLERKRILSRSKRCFLPSTRFAVERARGVRLYRLRAWSAEELDPLWADRPPGTELKRSTRGWVSSVVLGGRAVCVKYRRYSLIESLRSLVEGHRLRRAYAGGHSLWVRGIPTAQVIALRERAVLGCVREAHLVTEFQEGATPLDKFLLREYWGKPGADARLARRKHLIARAVGAFVRSIHDAGLSLHDLSPQNILVLERALPESPPKGSSDGTEFLLLVDLDHLYPWKPVTRRAKRKNLAQVANFPEGHVSAADLLRGLEAYARGDAELLSAGVRSSLWAALLDEHLEVLSRLSRRALEADAGTRPMGDST